MKKYNNLNLDRESIEPAIRNYCAENLQQYSLAIKNNPKNKTLTNYKVSHKNGEMATISIFSKSNGTTTIDANVGRNKELSLAITDHVIKTTQIDDRDSFILTFKDIKREDTKLLFEYLRTEIGANETIVNNTPSKMIRKFDCEYGDSVTISYYSTESLLIQGKPIHLYKHVIHFLSEYMSLEEIIQGQSTIIKVDIDPSDIVYEYEALLPKTNSILGTTISKILSSALTIKKVNVSLDDYSLFTYPALRGLEGYIKILLINKGINLHNKSFSDIFDMTGDTRIIKSGIKTRINCTFTEDALLKCYDFFNKHRHTLFHVDEIPEATRIISNKSEANGIIDDVFQLIEETYRLIPE